MISDEVMQAAIIERIKTITSVTNLLGDGVNGVKEFDWQGDTFTYPAIRVDLETNEYSFDEQEQCKLQYAEFSIYVYSEERSSKQCSMIKGLLATALIGLGFRSSQNILVQKPRLIDNVPVIRQDDRLWRSQLKLGSRVI